MKPPRVFRVLLLSLVLLALGWAMGEFIGKRDGAYRSALDHAATLERKAKQRFDAFGDMSPCNRDHREWPESARRSLSSIGEPRHHLLVVVAPTFSEIMILGVSPSGVDRYVLPGVTAFGPEFVDSSVLKPQKLPSIEVGKLETIQLSAAIDRNVRYALGHVQPGLDGTNYYFSAGEEFCSVTWSPQLGASHELVSAVEAILTPEASVSLFREALARLEQIESGY